MSEWTNTPAAIGWHDVRWEPSDPPARVFVKYATAEGCSWGWDAEDDPEWMQADSGAQWRPVQEPNE